MLKLNGKSLSLHEFISTAKDSSTQIELTPDAWDAVRQSHKGIDNLIKNNQIAYGITTGFGSLKDCVIPEDQLEQLQLNLILSHAVGTGNPIPGHRVRGMLILRINTLARGNSGVSEDLLIKLINFFNLNIYSKIPEQGTVGASGDLAPLAHLILGYVGEGELWNPRQNSYQSAKEVLKEFNLRPLRLKAKEGLALINGTQFITTHLAEAIFEARRLLDRANVSAAVTLEALSGTLKAFDPRIHQARPHPGQIKVASTIENLLKDSSKLSKTSVQDAYSLRCLPQVHGPLSDTLDFVTQIVTTEMNSSTDNPLVFPNGQGESDIISGGNFHGQYPAMAADYLAIALTTLGNISERRVERLVNGSLSKLPSFLILNNPGLNSGCMILQYTAAALTAENRTLSYPSSVTSVPTCENQEDHVSMGGFGARKLLNILNNVYHIVSIETFCGIQALAHRSNTEVAPPLQNFVKEIQNIAPKVTTDRYMAPEIEAIKNYLKK